MGRFAWLLVGLVLLATAGCGYVISSSLDGREARTVRLDGVENRLFPPRAGLEYELTRRLKDEIAADRRLELSEGPSDLRLEVVLTSFVEPTLVEDFNGGLPAEIQLRAAAVVQVTGPGVEGGRIRRKVKVSTSYAPSLGDGRREGLERLWRDLAREIVDVAADWEWASRESE